MVRSLLAGVLCLAAPLAAARAGGRVSFNRDIRPIMSDTCFRCHGPDQSTRMAGLRLDLREEALKRTATGVIPIVPGKPEESAVVARVFATSAAKLMPPKYSHKELTEDQKQTIRQWVAEGAEYEGHWSYMPIRRPAVPAVENAPTPIDAFIRARLAEAGLKPSPEADRRTLLRRVSLDLTGIPPTPEEIRAFLADASPNAYEKVVDRLIASKRYAEKQAMHWLDAVRYADTAGFHGDNPYPVWPYRDWVLTAIDANMPFDQFTREQLAGDLLPNATRSQRIASTYNRLNRVSAEGGVQPKEYLAKYGADRVRTTSSVWLGMTTGCAECHDHKFDPILARDFYSMKAFFADILETGLVPDRGPKAWGAQLLIATPEQETRLAAAKARLDLAERKLNETAGKRLATAHEWKWLRQRPTAASAKNGTVLRVYNDEPVEATYDSKGSLVTEKVPGDGLVLASGPNPDNEVFTVRLRPGEGAWTALSIEAVQDDSLPGARVARGADRFVLSEVEIESAGAPVPASLAVTTMTNATPDLPAMAAIDGDPRTGWGQKTYGGSGNPLLIAVFANPVRTSAAQEITVRLRFEDDIRRAVAGRLRFALSQAEVPAELLPVWREHARAEAEYGLLESSIPRVLAVERTEPEPVRILPRGNFLDESGDVVEPAPPAFLNNLKLDRRATRLDLAEWIVSRGNPLTARVWVNRMWRQFFGTGLSKVLDDLGSQGEWPTHPELLDWLAAEFQEDWDMKRLNKTIVMSAAYRQASSGNAEAERKDPDNRLLARQSRFRVDAETVRDIALAVSGLLSEKFGGPSVRPAQPDGFLAALNFPKREYYTSRGEDQYRRGLYTHWQRTFLHPSLAAFDAPTREECAVNRVNSNTPLQSLVLLNDPIYVEASRVFAENILAKGGPTLAAQLDWAFERATGRLPGAEERSVLARLHAESLAEFSRSPRSAAALANAGEAPHAAKAGPVRTAAMTNVARAILNLSETITRN
jgi:cytochrome c553